MIYACMLTQNEMIILFKLIFFCYYYKNKWHYKLESSKLLDLIEFKITKYIWRASPTNKQTNKKKQRISQIRLTLLRENYNNNNNWYDNEMNGLLIGKVFFLHIYINIYGYWELIYIECCVFKNIFEINAQLIVQ